MNTPLLSRISGGNILIVDDTRDNLHLLVQILSSQGYTVRPATSGLRALAAARAAPPDLILLDIMMPDMDGYAVCEAMKADVITRDIPIIFMSALGDVFDKVRAFAAGGVDYITKPFQIEEMVARITIHLTIRRTQFQLQQLNEQLAHSVRQLEQYSQEQFALNRMSNALQRAQSYAEAVKLSLPFLRDLFGTYTGTLFLLDTDTGLFTESASWGRDLPLPVALSFDTCQSLITGHMCLMKDQFQARTCAECQLANVYPRLCVPLKTRSDVLGILFLQADDASDEHLADTRVHLAVMVADLLALALSNLNLREQLREQAIRDPLTGLYNRRFLDESLSRELRQVDRYHRSLVVVLLDLDHFKRINDTYGHDTGDVVLSTVGMVLQQSLRGGDIACRYGGEEFLLVLTEITLEQARVRAEDLRLRIRQMSISHNGTTLDMITTSIGIAGFPDHATTPAMIIAAADQALYQAKANGRDGICIASPLRSHFSGCRPR